MITRFNLYLPCAQPISTPSCVGSADPLTQKVAPRLRAARART